MSENSLKETVTRLATPLVQAQGLEIWGVEIAQAGRTTAIPPTTLRTAPTS